MQLPLLVPTHDSTHPNYNPDIPTAFLSSPHVSDESYKNDMCPRFFIRRSPEDNEGINLWADHINPEMREEGNEDEPRFLISPCFFNDGDLDIQPEMIYCCNTWHEAWHFIQCWLTQNTAIARERQRNRIKDCLLNQ